VKLFLFVSLELSDARRIAIRPFVAFGRPVIARRSISTAAIVGRIDAGESAGDVAADHDLDIEDIEDIEGIEEAVLYERAARPTFPALIGTSGGNSRPRSAPPESPWRSAAGDVSLTRTMAVPSAEGVRPASAAPLDVVSDRRRGR